MKNIEILELYAIIKKIIEIQSILRKNYESLENHIILCDNDESYEKYRIELENRNNMKIIDLHSIIKQIITIPEFHVRI